MNPAIAPVSPIPEDLLRNIDKRKSPLAEHRERGSEALRNEDWKLAAKELQAALDADPQNDELRYSAAVARFRLREWGTAAALLNRILTRHPQDPAALELLGIVEVQQHRYKSAIPHLTDAIAVGRHGATVYAMRAQANSEIGEHIAAFADTDRAIAAGTEDAGLFLLRCSLAIRLNRRTDAEEALQNARQRGGEASAVESLATAIEKLP